MKNNTNGFSLIEIMVALVILAVGLTGLLGFSTMSIRAARDNDKWTTARQLAVSAQEELSSTNFNDLQTLAGNSTSASGSRAVYVNGETYTVSWQYDRMGGTSTDPLKVHIAVSFPGLLGAPVQVDTIRYTLL